jgi:hypothetical protein
LGEPSDDQNQEATMNDFRRLQILSVLACALTLASAKADTIWESALLGPQADEGTWIGTQQFVGTRFHLANPTEVQQVGGALYSSGTIFGGIFALSGPTAFPAGNPFDETPLALTVFVAQYSPFDWDIRTPLDVTLAPGDYALVFGSGLYGATGLGVANNHNIDVPGSSCLWWNGWYAPSASWFDWDPGFNGSMRFVVEGVTVPEPGCMGIFAIGAVLMFLGSAVRRNWRITRAVAELSVPA